MVEGGVCETDLGGCSEPRDLLRLLPGRSSRVSLAGRPPRVSLAGRPPDLGRRGLFARFACRFACLEPTTAAFSEAAALSAGKVIASKRF